MTDDTRLDPFRKWTLEVLDLLGAPPDRQIDYVRSAGVDIDEIVLQFDDMLHVARARAADGTMTGDEYQVIARVHDFVSRLTSAEDSPWEESSLRAGTEWGEARAAAADAREILGQRWAGDLGT